MGLASFLLDSLSGRGIREVCTGGDGRINNASLVADAYRALELLATHPRIDASRIAIMGFSYGGRVAVWASHTRFQQLWNPSGSHKFAAYLAFYPISCYVKLLDEEQVSGGPIRIFHGVADDAVPISRCREYVEGMRRAGKDVALVEYPGALHSFDNPGVPGAAKFYPKHLNPGQCTFVERPDGQLIDQDSGRPAGPDAPCLSRGYTQGYNERIHRQAIEDVKTFLYATFKMNQ